MKIDNEIYNQLAKACYELAQDFDLECDEDCYENAEVEVEKDGVVYCFCVDFNYYAEWRDESFDHAFGMWRDPWRGWYLSGVELIKCNSFSAYRLNNGEDIDDYEVDNDELNGYTWN